MEGVLFAMLRARLFNFILFFASLAVVTGSEPINVNNDIFLKALLIYLLFSTLYFHLRVISTSGNITFDYGISYGLSFALFTGPIGLLIFETIYRFTIYFRKKWTNTADPDEFFDTFYNIGSFVLSNTIAFYLFKLLFPFFSSFPFGFWLLLILLVCVISLLSDIFLITVFSILGEIKTRHDVIDFIKSRSVLDMGKTAFTNGLLFLFLQEGQWEMLISLFILNYLVSHSFVSKSQNIQNKIERDKFEQMAYTDFLTGVSNRAFMDKRIAELNESEECIGIIVADIDKFKAINDNFNHAIGDKVIQHFATTLKSYLNEDDSLFRSGGEEFTIFLRNKDFDQCVALVEKILVGVENSSVNVEYEMEQQSISYTSSFGLYYFKVNQNVTMEKGYVQADQLLLHSKHIGRNRISAENGLL
jgi:diguanylate cyclase (GGDEF)-like protein